MVSRGSTVTLSVSSGPDTVEVPDLKGDDKDEAATLLTNLGLKLGTSTEVDGSDVDKGKIVASDPATGQTVPVGTAVNVMISSGKAVVPDVVGMTRNDAADKLAGLGFNIKTAFQESTEPENTVLKQSAKAGAKLDYGSSITITVAQPAPPSPTTTTAPPSPTTTTTTAPPPTTPATTPTTGTTP
jgi:eukaryotic-like serine/threonine-protein kinase